MDIVSSLFANPVTYLLAVAVVVGRVYVERLVKGSVDTRFSERIEEHKHSLGMIAARGQFDLQKELADFNLFAARKQQAAAEVWTACRVAHGDISALFGVTREYTYEDFNSEDMRGHLTTLEVPKKMQEEILKEWDSDRDASMRVLRPYLRSFRIAQADRRLTKARNTVFLNELYFPDSIIQKLNLLFDRMGGWLFAAENPPARGEEPAPRCTRAELDAGLEDLHSAMRVYIGLEQGVGSTELLTEPPNTEE